MNFLKTLFWVVVTAVAVVFSVNNWSPIFPVQLWGGFVADTHVPVLMIGSFLLGLIMPVALGTALLSPTLRLTLTTGVLGGFTTYSTFNYETLQYLQEGAWAMAGLNVATTLLLCLAAGALGVAVARGLLG